jgi:hypothetical protein
VENKKLILCLTIPQAKWLYRLLAFSPSGIARGLGGILEQFKLKRGRNVPD